MLRFMRRSCPANKGSRGQPGRGVAASSEQIARIHGSQRPSEVSWIAARCFERLRITDRCAGPRSGQEKSAGIRGDPERELQLDSRKLAGHPDGNALASALLGDPGVIPRRSGLGQPQGYRGNFRFDRIPRQYLIRMHGSW